MTGYFEKIPFGRKFFLKFLGFCNTFVTPRMVYLEQIRRPG